MISRVSSRSASLIPMIRAFGGNDLAVENGVIDVERGRHLAGESFEPGHDVVVPRDQTVAALLEIADGPETVVFEFEEPVRVVERLLVPSRRDRLHARKGHHRDIRRLTLSANCFDNPT